MISDNTCENNFKQAGAELGQAQVLVRVVDNSQFLVFSTQLKLKLKLQLSFHYYSWWVGGWLGLATRLGFEVFSLGKTFDFFGTKILFKLKIYF